MIMNALNDPLTFRMKSYGLDNLSSETIYKVNHTQFVEALFHTVTFYTKQLIIKRHESGTTFVSGWPSQHIRSLRYVSIVTSKQLSSNVDVLYTQLLWHLTLLKNLRFTASKNEAVLQQWEYHQRSFILSLEVGLRGTEAFWSIQKVELHFDLIWATKIGTRCTLQSTIFILIYARTVNKPKPEPPAYATIDHENILLRIPLKFRYKLPCVWNRTASYLIHRLLSLPRARTRSITFSLHWYNLKK